MKPKVKQTGNIFYPGIAKPLP